MTSLLNSILPLSEDYGKRCDDENPFDAMGIITVHETQTKIIRLNSLLDWLRKLFIPFHSGPPAQALATISMLRDAHAAPHSVQHDRSTASEENTGTESQDLDLYWHIPVVLSGLGVLVFGCFNTSPGRFSAKASL